MNPVYTMRTLRPRRSMLNQDLENLFSRHHCPQLHHVVLVVETFFVENPFRSSVSVVQRR